MNIIVNMLGTPPTDNMSTILQFYNVGNMFAPTTDKIMPLSNILTDRDVLTSTA